MLYFYMLALVGVALALIFLWTRRKRDGAMHKSEYRPFTLISTTEMTHNSKMLVFRGDVSLGPGRHLMVKCPCKDGSTKSKPYSPTQIGQETFHIAVKRYEGGAASTYLHSLKEGDSVSMRGPTGTFDVDKVKHDRMLLVAGGSGITPLYSVIRDMVKYRLQDFSEMFLLFCNHSRDDIMLGKELDELRALSEGKLKILHVFSAEHGRLSSEQFKAICDELQPSFVGVCGPMSLIVAIKRFMASHGILSVKPVRSPIFWHF